MKRKLGKWGIVLISMALIVGCAKEEEEKAGGTGGGSGDIFIEGGVGRVINQMIQRDSVFDYAVIDLRTPDSAGTPISDATVKINGVTLPYTFGVYMGNIAYERKYSYTLEVQATQGQATASVTSPDLDSVKITSPSPGAHFEKGQDLQVSWQYFGSPPSGVFVTVETEENTIDSMLLDGSKTTYTVSGDNMVFDGYGTVNVYAANYVYITGIAEVSVFGAGVGASLQISVGDTSGGGGGGTGYTITVTPGTNPVFDWQPSGDIYLLTVYETTSDTLWQIGGIFSPPVTYGTVPEGGIQVVPPLGQSPPSLESGHTYTVTVWGPEGSGEQDFTQP